MDNAHRSKKPIARLTLRPAEGGSVTLLALLIMLLVMAIGAGFMRSLLGEAQGGIGSRYATSALAVSEAGLHWAGNMLTGTSAATYTYVGSSDHVVQGAGGQQVGVFDVDVVCVDGVTLPTANACAGVQPYRRLIRATGYVPSKTVTLGRRRLEARVAQNTFFDKAICGYDSVNFDQGAIVRGDVGSEASITLYGPPINPSRINPSPPGVVPPQAGNAYAVGTITCSVNCNTQIAGTVNPGQPAGSVCPNRVQVRSTYNCTPGSTDLIVPASGSASISSANRFLRNVTTGQFATITFVTTGPNDVLDVHVRSIVAGKNTRFLIAGGGKVRLHIEDQLWLGQSSQFGVDASTNSLVEAYRMVVNSCSNPADGDPVPAVQFNQTGQISGLFIVPYGKVQLDQAQLTKGAILAGTIQFDRGNNFAYDSGALNIGFGFNILNSWQDLP